MITAENITTDRVVEIFHSLSDATDRCRRTMRMAQDSDITPAKASEALNIIIARLQAEFGREQA